MRTKLFYTELDTIFNTGLYKSMIVEMFFCLVMPYPFLYGYTYTENADPFSAGYIFYWNDWLLCFMIFFRLHFLVRSILSNSFYTDPRAQRVCAIYGCQADFKFALKAIMKDNPWMVLSISMVITLMAFSYQLRLFERRIDPNFNNITTAMWCMVVTMTTVGYGDVYPKSQMGRMICIIIAFWGVFYVSLFVVALTNILNFESVESKAYMLLQRLNYKDQLREEAAGMLTAKFRVRLTKQSLNDADAVKTENKIKSLKY